MDVRGNRTENYLELQGRASIRLNKMYYKHGDEVILEFTVKNFGNEPMRVFPTLVPLKSYQFLITDENDESVVPKENLFVEDTKLKRRNKVVNLVGDDVKEVIIHKGESFSRKINLSEYYEFQPGKKYYVTGFFYPNYWEDSSVSLKTENNSIFVLESKKPELPSRRPENLENKQNGLTPEEVIHLFLSAEMKKNWENYFKYLHLPEYIHAYPKFSKEYADSHSDHDYQVLVLEEFKKYLMDSVSGKLTYYKIVKREEPSTGLARVSVYVERELNRFPSKYEYIYTLKQNNDTLRGFWKISSVVVKVRR
jgi:hypothetical protein